MAEDQESEAADLRERFSRAVAALFPPPRTSKPLSRVLGINQRQVQYMLAGQVEPALALVELLERQLEIVQGLRTQADIEAQILRARAAGAEDEVISAILTALHDQHFGRSID